MKIAFLSALFLTILLSPMQSSSASIQEIKRLINKTNEKELSRELREFVRATWPGRYPGSKGHLKARSYIKNKIKAWGEDFSVHTFSPDYKYSREYYLDQFNKNIASKYGESSKEYVQWKNFLQSLFSSFSGFSSLEGENIIWEKKGVNKQAKTLFLFANYDSLSLDKKTLKIVQKSPAPGTDDNGTGVVLALKFIEIIKQLKIEQNVKVVFFDFQEYGGLGAKSFVDTELKKMNQASILGAVNLFMLGHDSKKRNGSGKLRDFKIYTSNLKDEVLAGHLLKKGREFTRAIDFSPSKYDIGLGDFSHFRKLSIGTCVFSQNHETDLNPRQHTESDIVETINFRSLYLSYRFILGGLAAFLR